MALNPADFSRNDRDGEYTVEIEVRGTISISIKADSAEDARKRAENELSRIEAEGYVEVDDVNDLRLARVKKDPPMYRVVRDGRPMQVSHLNDGDLPREPDRRGF